MFTANKTTWCDIYNQPAYCVSGYFSVAVNK